MADGDSADGRGTIGLADGAGWARDKPVVRGRLIHSLPGTLRDITMVVVTGQQDVRRWNLAARAGDENYIAYAFKHAEWPADEPLDLAVMTTKTGIPTFRGYVKTLRPQIQQYNLSGQGAKDFPGSRVDQLTAWAFFNQLEPPELESDDSGARYAAQRWSTHGWDLGRWFTQPCVIIVGHLTGDGPSADAPSPVPLSLDGEAIVTKGRTIVRWVYPLPTAPPAFRQTGRVGEIEAEPETEPAVPDADADTPAPEAADDGGTR